MSIPSNITDRIETETKEEETSIDRESLNTSLDDAYTWDTTTGTYVDDSTETSQSKIWKNISDFIYEPNDEVKSLVKTKEHSILDAQTIFKKSIRISLKSFLISLTLTFLNIFV